MAIKKDDLADDKRMKQLSKDLALGQEHKLTCSLCATDGKLGRSTVFDLNAKYAANYRQIDHRTISSLIIQNKRYIAK